jgi:tetratricopeptide (TPR) repeat protein
MIEDEKVSLSRPFISFSTKGGGSMDTVIAEIQKIFISDKLDDSEKIEKGDSILAGALKQDPTNTQLWILRALLALEVPVVDYIRSLEYIRNILGYDPNHTIAWILLAYIQETHEELHEDVKDSLVNLLDKEKNPEKRSLLNLAIAWYYFSKDFPTCEQYLLQAIRHFPGYPAHYRWLQSLYIYHRKNLGKIRELAENAVKHIEIIYIYDNDQRFIQQIQPYLGENFKGFVPGNESRGIPNLDLFLQSEIKMLHTTDSVAKGYLEHLERQG